MSWLAGPGDSRAKLGELLTEINALCQRLNRRVGELGDVDLFTIRRDPVVRKLTAEICEAYRRGVEACAHYRKGEEPEACALLREEPACLRRILLSGEVACPVSLSYSRLKGKR